MYTSTAIMQELKGYKLSSPIIVRIYDIALIRPGY